MITLRTLLHLMLALALVAGGVLPGPASSAPHDHAAPAALKAQTEAAPSCHGQASAPAEQAAVHDSDGATDCCGGQDDCRCSCLHHAPVAVTVEIRLPAVRYRWLASIGHAVPLHSIRAAPAIRPPIA